MFRAHFIFVVIVLFTGNIIATIITANSGNPDSAWWPVFLCVFSAVSLVYAGLFSLLAKWKKMSIFPAGYVHILVAVSFVVLIILFYKLPTDWNAINNGAEMSSLQKLVHSDISGYILYLVGFLMSLLVGYTSKSGEIS
ncbi:hypothetical protein OIZ54_00790 [Pseudoalteromonas sp. A3]|uniref:hypothetical protein n=1 Tax=Pseudoalteromonas sp. A3 TaxID=142792 RepID=UPI00221FB453|nr:hypothetical protein [Pseudoalteromonas sp. A3]MCW1717276.1 hypothetical protein [Pseudoalteromonas sp. A3]